MKIFKAALGVIGLLTGINANAATIHHEKMDETTEVIGIFGDIVSADLERFRQISLRHPKAIVVLSSNGGLIYPAIEIGKIIKIMGYTTVVTDKDVCASACALIWMAGSNRVASYDGNVGFHASYRNDSGKLVEVGAANALIGNYLTLLGESAKTVVFATAAPPDRILWLTAANKEAAGIDFHNFTPSQRRASSSAKTPPPVRTVVHPPKPMPTVKANPRVSFPPLPPGFVAADDRPSQADVIMWEDIPPINPVTNEPFVGPPKWEWVDASQGAPWAFTFITKEAGNIYYINQNTFRKYSNDGWEFWVKSEILNQKNKLILVEKNLVQINCIYKNYRIISHIRYNENGNVESSNFDDNIYSNKFEPFVPESVMDGLHELVCKRW